MGWCGYGGLDVSRFSQLLPPQFGGGGDVGGELLAERLHALAMERVLPALGRLLEVAGAQPLPLGAGLGMERHQIRPEASGLLSQRLTLGAYGWGQAA